MDRMHVWSTDIGLAHRRVVCTHVLPIPTLSRMHTRVPARLTYLTPARVVAAQQHCAMGLPAFCHLTSSCMLNSGRIATNSRLQPRVMVPRVQPCLYAGHALLGVGRLFHLGAPVILKSLHRQRTTLHLEVTRDTPPCQDLPHVEQCKCAFAL